MAKSRRYLLFISLMFGILFNLGNPAIPVYTNSLDIEGMFVGFYLASGGLGLMLFATIWGAIGDILDRNKVLAITFMGFETEYISSIALASVSIVQAGDF